MNDGSFRYHHVGIPADMRVDCGHSFSGYGAYRRGCGNNRYGIGWMRYEDDGRVPELLKKVPCLGSEADGINEEIRCREGIIEPDSQSHGVTVAFAEENNMPVELLQFTRKISR
ncbi:MAG TPA: hypothetical protein PK747_04000 [Acidobacteriota bacterium]|nr:hypothetical protein [Acidobacteriota bacterium]HNT17581.1 hypothetical protein [Acidobacteriota bacterium]HPA26978.1 hypothetical protein [Acidobacteriota bacterium]HQO19676.1 hypothetical protein [Acidobacteriota bacterium]HQQ46555.1 hypothetical protein [Acidobacteriota bacterium]